MDAVAARARIFKALGHPVRLALVMRLAAGARCVCELVPCVPGRQATVSRHLAVLVNAGVLRRWREGTRMMYVLAVPCLLDALPCIDRALKGKRACAPAAGRRRQVRRGT